MTTTLWETFNSNDSWLPFILPSSIWCGGFIYCYWPSSSKRPEFHNWQAYHNLHNFGGMAIALLSLYFGDDSVFNERISILWTLGYFLVDLLDCLWRRDVAFSLHAIFCIVLGTGCYTSPVFRLLRINSKALLCELSSPFLHIAKRTRTPLHFLMFALVFMLCRVLWLPYFLSELRHHNLSWYDFRVYFLLLFYGLNLYWFYKIVRIIMRNDKGNTKKQTNNHK